MIDYHDAFKLYTLDDDNGVVLQDCIDVSRVIENFRQRRARFSLEVASAGFSSLKHQTIQENVGRTLIVKTGKRGRISGS
jgi:ribosome maturation factor RimP